MKTTIDKAGRIVIPKPMREALGLRAGTEVDVVIDGVAIRIDPPAPPEPEVALLDGWFQVIKGAGPVPSDVVEQLRNERLDSFERRANDA